MKNIYLNLSIISGLLFSPLVIAMENTSSGSDNEISTRPKKRQRMEKLVLEFTDLPAEIVKYIYFWNDYKTRDALHCLCKDTYDKLQSLHLSQPSHLIYEMGSSPYMSDFIGHAQCCGRRFYAIQKTKELGEFTIEGGKLLKTNLQSIPMGFHKDCCSILKYPDKIVHVSNQNVVAEEYESGLGAKSIICHGEFAFIVGKKGVYKTNFKTKHTELVRAIDDELLGEISDNYHSYFVFYRDDYHLVVIVINNQSGEVLFEKSWKHFDFSLPEASLYLHEGNLSIVVFNRDGQAGESWDGLTRIIGVKLISIGDIILGQAHHIEIPSQCILTPQGLIFVVNNGLMNLNDLNQLGLLFKLIIVSAEMVVQGNYAYMVGSIEPAYETPYHLTPNNHIIWPAFLIRIDLNNGSLSMTDAHPGYDISVCNLFILGDEIYAFYFKEEVNHWVPQLEAFNVKAFKSIFSKPLAFRNSDFTKELQNEWKNCLSVDGKFIEATPHSIVTQLERFGHYLLADTDGGVFGIDLKSWLPYVENSKRKY